MASQLEVHDRKVKETSESVSEGKAGPSKGGDVTCQLPLKDSDLRWIMDLLEDQVPEGSRILAIMGRLILENERLETRFESSIVNEED